MTSPVIRTPDQRLRVFISSTLQEVADEREAAREAITRLRLYPVMFELGARPHPPRDLYRAYLEQSHIFIGIYWQRYGWVAPGETISGLEDEYRLSSDKPRLIYIKSPAPEREPRLKDLLDDVKNGPSYKYFSTASELRDLIENDLMVLLSERFDTPAEAPPARAIPAVTNLPAELSRFVGRDRELEEVKQRLAKTRMLTLTGSGGTGKTRLALRAAAGLLERFEGRVFFADLSSSRTTDAALSAIARVIGIRETTDGSLLDDIKAHIGQQQVLLVLDNFEQVTVAAPAMADLLRECPGLHHLVTSREPLRVAAEQVLHVQPLSLPGPGEAASAQQLLEYEAVQLFVERAQAVSPTFQLTEENVGAVAELCIGLDGLPLAIELAAARLTLFSPRDLVDRLADRLKLLTAGARDAPLRQRTLRDTVAWSYDMLDADEQCLLQVISVFSGSRLDALEAVAEDLGLAGRTNADVLDVAGSLADKSLVRQTLDADGSTRLTMLQTIREYANERLEEDAGFAAAARHAHARTFAGLTRRLAERLSGEGREQAAAQLDADIENIRAAWRYWVANADLERLRECIDGLWQFYDLRGWYHATADLANDLLQILASTPPTPQLLREQITLQTSLARVLLTTRGYTPEVEEAFTRALELAEASGDPAEADISQVLPVLRGLSSFYLFRAEFDKGAEIGRQLLALAERHGDVSARVEGHLVLGACLAMSNELRSGLEHLETGISAYNAGPPSAHRFRVGNDPGVVCLTTSALVRWMLGYPEQALRRASDSIALATALNYPASVAYAHFHAGLLHLWRREDAAAEERAQTVLEVGSVYDLPTWTAVGSCLHGAALAGMGHAAEGVTALERGIEVYRGLRTPPVFWPLLLYLQARTYRLAGRADDGIALVEEIFALPSGSSSSGLTPEFFMLKGDLLLARSPERVAEAEAQYREAIAMAAKEEALMLQLRAALRLSRLWRDQGKVEEARSALAGVYAGFSEGHDTADLMEAKDLLDSLA